MSSRVLRIAAALLAFAVFAFAVWVLHRELGGGRVQEVLRTAANFSRYSILLAVGFTALSFLVLTGYDNLSLRYIRRPLPYRHTALASFLNYAFSQALGFPVLTGGTVRYRLYSRWGLSALEVTQVVAFASLTFWLGVATLTGIVLLWTPPGITRILPVTDAAVRPVGVLLLAIVAAYVWWSVTGRRVAHLFGWRLRRPTPKLAALQLTLACVDWTVASAACWVLMPTDIGIGFPSFVAVFLLAFVAGIVSHVPAGLGVFESVILLLLPAVASDVDVLASLLVYRGVYQFLPLLLATLLLGIHELGRSRTSPDRHPDLAGVRRRPRPPFSLRPHQRETLDALCRTIVPHAFTGELTHERDGLPSAVERRLVASGPILARRVAIALTMFGHPLARLLHGGRLRRFAALSPAERDESLRAWRDSDAAPRRTIYQGLRRLILSTHYANPGALAEVGWLGPLHERTPELAWEGPLDGLPDDADPVLRAGHPERAADAAGEPSEGAPPRTTPPTRAGMSASARRGGELAGTATLRAGVCVIGSGSAGAVAAARLAEQGHDVLVVEEGSHWEPHDFTEREADMMPALYAEGGLRGTQDLAVSVLQGRAVGGSALVNWLVMLRTPDWVLEEWQREHGAEGLSPDELAPVFARIEAETHTRCVPHDAHSPANRALLDGARALGWSARAASINAEGCVRAGTCGLGCRWNAKRGPATVYLPRAIRHGARVLADCRVDRLETGRGPSSLNRVRCSLLDATSGRIAGSLTIEAPLIVLAAGAVGTPAILRRSGLGGPAVGRYLRLHPTTAVVGVYDRPMYAAAGIPISALCDEFHRGNTGYGFWLECPPLYPAFASAALPGWGAPHRARMTGFGQLGPLISLVRDGADRSLSSGDVRVNRRGDPVLRYRLSALDRRTLVEGVRAAAELHLAAGAREAFSLHERPHVVRSRTDLAALEQLDFAPNRFSLFSAHVMGSCRLGVDARTSVCTPDGAVRGVPNVYVADGSVLPTAPAVNPQETIMAVASVLAGRIGARHATR